MPMATHMATADSSRSSTDGRTDGLTKKVVTEQGNITLRNAGEEKA